jgi:putative transposase
VLRFLVCAISAALRPRALLVAENVCLWQQLGVLQRRHRQPRLRNGDRQFWICASRWFADWRNSLLIVKPETVLRWHRRGWRAYWSWRSNRGQRRGRRPISKELQALIRQMTAENRLWGQKRIQAELARLGFRVSARTVAKYMTRRHNRGPSPGWREFLKRHESNIWACDFFCVRTIWFRTLYVFFVVPARQSRNFARRGDAVSDCGVDCPADSRMLRLGSMAATFSHSRPRQPLWRDIRPPRATPWH